MVTLGDKMSITKKRLYQITAGLTFLSLTACSAAGVAIGVGAQTGVLIAQERTVGNAIDDTTIRIKLNGDLLSYDNNLFLDVSTEVVEGRVLLTGNVDTPEDKVTAARIAWNVAGVREVINEMEVKNDTGILDFASDVWIGSQLRARILTDIDISSINYTIEVLNGTIYLLGVAQSEAELKRVTDHARVIKGVNKVISHVLLKGDDRRPIPKTNS